MEDSCNSVLDYWINTAMLRFIVFSCVVAGLCWEALGHGMVLQPVNRASRWRYNSSAPTDFDDNGLFCGGRDAQWSISDGKCGLCGDNYADSPPRKFELGGGIFGEGVIVKNYIPGNDMYVQILIMANHLGHFIFKLCNLDIYASESEECFDDVLLLQKNGDSKFVIDDKVGLFNVTLELPKFIECNHCVLQWTWTTGNSWGTCENGIEDLGCGAQETYRTCSDVSINS